MTHRKSLEPSEEILPEELLWADAGHASDVVLSVLADGHLEIVPAPVLAHVAQCAACTTQLGHAALLSMHVGAELGALREHELQAVKRPVPRLAIALGLICAALGLVPGLLDGGPASPSGGLGSAMVLVRFGTTLVHALLAPGSRLGLLLTYGAAAALVIAAFVLVKVLPRKEVSS